ncbi:MAG: serine hydrolase [Algoriphagus sp.]|uniref:serine hydrolase domain-containing protein n=1 Tax=Algoriphagus sp. TaxID=1872435 RepID=UPI0018100AEC|nr:serine hydrolase domain-containing protein [Algoriphagus sp.]NVJ84846.1 serine hydrolase [Algoriphagus sp.]
MYRKFNFLVLFLVLCLPSVAQEKAVAIEKLVQRLASQQAFEGTVLVAEKGEPIYHQSFGFKDENKIFPVANSTKFGIASITKLFTAIVILQLVEEGQVKLTDALHQLFPTMELPNSDKITVHHLLLHISGLPNEDFEIYTTSQISLEEFIKQTLSNDLNTFGEFNYANIDYVLLGLIIEKFDGRPWASSVQNRILDKLAMAQTGFLEKGKYPKDFAYSFSYDENYNRNADPFLFIENYASAGSMYSTAMDLLKFDQALYSDQLLSKESKDLLYKSYPEYNFSGYSVWTYNYPFSKTQPMIMERRGGILGANSVLVRFLDSNQTIIILSNNNKFNPDSFGNTNALKEALIIELDNTRD